MTGFRGRGSSLPELRKLLLKEPSRVPGQLELHANIWRRQSSSNERTGPTSCSGACSSPSLVPSVRPKKSQFWPAQTSGDHNNRPGVHAGSRLLAMAAEAGGKGERGSQGGSGRV